MMTPHDTISGFQIEVEPLLRGIDRTLLQGGKLYVGPDLFEQMKVATSEELLKLLEKTEVVRLPSVNPLHEPLPTVAQRPAFAENPWRDAIEVYARMSMMPRVPPAGLFVHMSRVGEMTADELDAKRDREAPPG